VYLTYGVAPHIEKRSSSGHLLASWGTLSPATDYFNGARGLTLDAHGDLYVANTATSTIQELRPDGTPFRSWGFPGSYPGQFHHPAGIAVGPRGEIFVADSDNHRIQRLSG
jgi:DNA-binding beta-propeller fold protein YncE